MAQVRIAMPTGNIPETSEVGTPLSQGTSDGTNGVRIIEVPLYLIPRFYNASINVILDTQLYSRQLVR